MTRILLAIPYAIAALIVCGLAELGPRKFADRVSWMVLGL
jgi:hypothetical protein